MGLRLEVCGYKIDPTCREDVIFDQPGDLESYNTHHAWDVLPTHFFQSSIKRRGGGGSPVRLEFNSEIDAATGLAKLNELKAKT